MDKNIKIETDEYVGLDNDDKIKSGARTLTIRLKTQIEFLIHNMIQKKPKKG